MPDYNSSFDKLRELELRRNMRQGNMPQPARAYQQRRYPANTLGPQEDVLEQRRGRNRKYVTTITSSPRQQQNVLLQNLFLLAALAGSICALIYSNKKYRRRGNLCQIKRTPDYCKIYTTGLTMLIYHAKLFSF